MSYVGTVVGPRGVVVRVIGQSAELVAAVLAAVRDAIFEALGRSRYKILPMSDGERELLSHTIQIRPCRNLHAKSADLKSVTFQFSASPEK